MDAVRADVEKLVEKELKSANQKFPMFRSDHEGAAVIFEEIEECKQEMENLEIQFEALWSRVKSDNKMSVIISGRLKLMAINLACEVIQVAAMSQKFIDSQKDSLEMDYDQMERAITEKTKAVIPVDLGGIPCDYDRIYQAVEGKKPLFCPKGDVQEALGRVAVVADCAHGLGASRHGVPTGALADFTSFSFHAVKNFTTAEGGASAWRTLPGLDDEELYHRYQLLSLHGQSKDALAKTKLGAWEYDIVGPWYKCNMTDIMAAIGLKQLERYPGLLERRHQLIQRYDEALHPLGIRTLPHFTPDYTSSGHLYLTWTPGIGEKERNEIILRMAERGVACNVHYKPLPMMTAYKAMGFDIADYPNAYHHYENLITLPLHTRLSDEDAAYVTEQFTDIVKEYLR